MTGECPLGLLNLPLKLTKSPKVFSNIGTGLLLVRLDEVFNDSVVEVFSSKMSVTSGGKDFEYTVVDGKKGNIESSTTEIVDNDLRLATLLIKAIGDGGGGRLVDDTKNLETGDSSGILGGLTLSVVEV